MPGSILKIEKVNFESGKQIEILGYAISAKRYVLYRYDAKGNIVIVDAKAHGLGYLYPPKDANKHDPKSNWLFEAWHWVVEGEVATPRPTPEWFRIPAMMRMTVSTPAILGLLNGFTKPFNFVHVPLLLQLRNSTSSFSAADPDYGPRQDMSQGSDPQIAARAESAGNKIYQRV